MIARLNFCATLADNNAACSYELPIKALDAEHFRVAIPTIAGTTHTFFMCHVLLFLTFSIFNAFSIFNFYCTAAACGLLLSRGVMFFTYGGLCFGFGRRCWS